MIQVTGTIAIDERELEFEFVRSSGPGGQNVNKVATAVQLRFDVDNSQSLPERVRERLHAQQGGRINNDGVLVITAQRYRSQDRNRQDAIDRLIAMVRAAARVPRRRKKTRPTAAARERRLDEKRRRGAVKKTRKRVRDED